VDTTVLADETRGSSASDSQPGVSLDLARVPAPGTQDAPPATDASTRARPVYPSAARDSAAWCDPSNPHRCRSMHACCRSSRGGR
jgi:hypothetical protein